MFAFAAVGLLVLDGLYVGARLYWALTDVRDRLQSAEAAIKDGRFDDAEQALVAAASAAGSAHDQGFHPSFVVATLVPGLSSNARAVQAITDAAGLSIDAALTVIRTPALQGEKKTVAQTVYEDAQVDFDVIDQLNPRIHEAHSQLERAVARLEGAPTPSIGPIGRALVLAHSRLASATDAAERGATMMDALPSLLARSTSRRYLLAFQTPSEARGSGGLLGVYGILEANNGRLRLRTVAPIGQLVRRGPVHVEHAPRWFEQTYGPLGALRQYQQANLTPNFPVAAQAWLDMYEDSTGKHLDGVLAMDPIALGELTRGTGPIRGPGLNVAVGSENAATVLLHDSYTEFGSRRGQDAYLAGLVSDFWSRLNGRELDASGLLTGLSNSATSQHLKFYSTSEVDQEALRELESDGNYDNFGGNVQVVFNNNTGVNKIDYFLQRRLETSILLRADGTAIVTTTATLTNTAPLSGGPSLMRGPGIRGIRQPGLNAMLIHFLLPEGSRVVRFEMDGTKRTPLRSNEGPHPVFFDLFDIRPESTRAATVTYEIKDAFSPGPPSDVSFTLVPQATVNPDQFELSISAPAGYSIAAGDAELRQKVVSGVLNEPTTIRATLEE